MTARTKRMRRFWQRLRTEPQLGRNVVILVVLVVLASVSGGVILSHQGSGLTNWPWSGRTVLRAQFDEAHGVAAGQGQEVRIAGVTVGAIQDARVDDDGKAELELGIDPKYTVHDNAVLVLRPKSPLNEMYVELNPGGPPGKPLADGALLPAANTRTPVTIDRVTQHLDDNVRLGLGSLIGELDAAVARAPKDLPAGLTATDKVLRDLHPVVAELNTRRETVARLVGALATISRSLGGDDERLTKLAASLHRTLRILGSKDGALNASLAQLPGLTTQLKAATEAVRDLGGELDPTVDNLRQASGSLPETLRRLAGTADRVGSFADRARPALTQAVPVVADLRPFVRDLRASLRDLQPVTGRLDAVTGALVPKLDDLQAFVYNTASATSVVDGDGGMLRGIAQFGPDTIPLLRTLGEPAK